MLNDHVTMNFLPATMKTNTNECIVFLVTSDAVEPKQQAAAEDVACRS